MIDEYKEGITMKIIIRMAALATTFALLAISNEGFARADSVSLNGAGASFPFPLYSKWVSEYNKLNPDVRINYQSIGSGGGIKQFSEGTVDFGGTDAFMKDDAIAKLGVKIHHIPTTMGAVAVVYNLKGISSGIRLTPDALAGIFLGNIKKWNDAAIMVSNPGATLPDTDIKVVHRSDGSGTTAVFTDYLSKISPEWKSAAGSGTSIKWPAGLGAKGNEGVTGQVKMTPGSIGYVEMAYAVQNKMPYASLKNKAGSFVDPTLESVSAAAAGIDMPADFRVSITDAGGKNAYPISAFTWILIHEAQKEKTKGKALVKFLWWAIHDGQSFGAPLNYAPLPESVVGKIESALKSIKYDGKTLIGNQ